MCICMYLVARMPWLKSRGRQCSCSRVNFSDSFNLKSANGIHVLLAASDNCYSTQLTWCACVRSISPVSGTPEVPLWNFSSIGGTIMRTFLRSSLVVDDMLGGSGIISCNGVNCVLVCLCDAKGQDRLVLKWLHFRVAPT